MNDFQLVFTSSRGGSKNAAWLAADIDDIPSSRFSEKEITYIKKESGKNDKGFFAFNRYGYYDFLILPPEIRNNRDKEKLRRLGSQLADFLRNENLKEIYLQSGDSALPLFYIFVEGFLLSLYDFSKYKSNRKSKFSIEKINIQVASKYEGYFLELHQLTQAVYMARNLVNEPPATMTANAFSQFLTETFEESSVKVEVLDKSKIHALRMGGLLGVNRGSKEPPTFNILEYKSPFAVNEKPIVLVGKGVMFDSGGLNIKTGNNMVDMKCDMSGGAAVASAIYAIAQNNLPVYVVGLIPATDNRPGENAMAPGDILTMSNGKTVEVLNTDAEGRLILADALCYAQKYDPQITIDIATLTGAAHAALGHYVIAGMHSKASVHLKDLIKSGDETYERVAELPFWDEYSDALKSHVADLKNIGDNYAGAITAGKFLEEFTDYPYIHLDIAGPAFLDAPWGYWPKGGTGVGVRLLYRFVKNACGMPDFEEVVKVKKTKK